MRTRSPARPAHLTAGFSLLLGTALVGAGCRDHGSASVAQRLLDCDLLTQGKLEGRPSTSARAQCNESCELQASCSELTALYCDAEKSAAIRDCQLACTQPAACRDGQGTYTITQVCDGREQCADGSDETGCPEPLVCEGSGARLQAYQRCNGVIDCTDRSDEADCEGDQQLFACRTRTRGLAQYVPYARVCDLVEDCADGSDEGAAQGCAELRCP